MFTRKKTKSIRPRLSFSSPSVSPDELSLKLGTGSSKYSYWRTAPETEMPWLDIYDFPKEMNSLLDKVVDRLNRDYSVIFKGCVFKYVLAVDLRRGSIKWERGLFQTEKRNVDSRAEEMLQKCLDSGPVFIAIPVSISEYFGPDHMNMLIINNLKGTFELYDPIGSEYHLETYGQKPRRTLRDYLESLGFRGYKFLSLAETNPKKGFQNFQISDTDYTSEGLCTLWSMYIAELRAKYIYTFPSAKAFSKAVEKRIDKLLNLAKKSGKDPQKTLELYLIYYLLEFISETELKDELSPRTPVDYDIKLIEDYFS